MLTLSSFPVNEWWHDATAAFGISALFTAANFHSLAILANAVGIILSAVAAHIERDRRRRIKSRVRGRKGVK